MSYDLKILKDNPIGYWSFNNTANDLTANANNAVLTATSYLSPPIIANSGSALKISNTSSVVISNTAGTYEVFSKYFDNKNFTIALWFNFNNQLTGAGNETSPYASNQLDIFYVKNFANEIWDQYTGYSVGTKVDYEGDVYVNLVATSDKIPPSKNVRPSTDPYRWGKIDNIISRIYYDYLSNTIRFSFSGSNNSDAYYVVDNFDRSFYIVANYSNGALSLNVNARDGINGSVNDTSVMKNYLKTYLTFNIDGSSITGTSTLPTNYLVSSLAFFTYKLTDAQIQQHLMWAGNDEKPVYQSILSASTSLFKMEEMQSDLGYYQSIYGDNFNKNGFVYNLDVTGNGLSPINITQPAFNNSYDLSASYSTNSSSGLSISGSAGLDIYSMPIYFNLQNSTVFSAQVFRTTALNEYIFSISNVDGKYLYLEYDYASSSSRYYVRLYDPYQDATTTLINHNAGASATSANIGVLFNSSSIVFYTSENGSSSTVFLTSSSPTYFPLSMDRQALVTVGNSYHSLKTFYSKIKNFGITDLAPTSFATFDFANTSTFMAKLTNSSYPFILSQTGNWTYNIPSANIQNYYVDGVSFDWRGMDNCLVYISTDSGSTFYPVKRNETATRYDTESTAQNIMVKVVLNTDYPLDTKYQSFNEISWNVYTDLYLHSDLDYYKLTSSSGTYANFTVSTEENSIFSRSNNFGMKFTGDDNKVQGYGLINVPASTNYSAVEFWYRPDSIDSYRTNLIQNPSFENYSGFFEQTSFLTITSSTSFLGASSLLVTASYIVSPGYPGFVSVDTSYQPFVVESGKTYTFSGYVKDVNTGSPVNGVLIWYGSANNYLGITTSSTSISSSAWTRASVTASAPVGATKLYPGVLSTMPIYSASDSGNGKSFYVDAVMLELSSSVGTYFDGTYAGNFVTNPSFESGSTGWSGNDTASITSASYDSLFGLNSLQVTQAARFYSGVVVGSDIPANPSTTYTFSYYVKPAPGTNSIFLGNIVHDKNSASTIGFQYNQNNVRYVYTGNLIANPSFESGSSGWALTRSNVSASIQTSSAYSYFGNNSLNLSIGSSSTSSVCYAFANVDVGSGTGSYTFSAYVYSPTTASMRIIFRDNGGALYDGGSLFTIPAATWTRVSKTVNQLYASARWSIGFEPDGVKLNSNLYIDGVMLEASASLNSYVEGSSSQWTRVVNTFTTSASTKFLKLFVCNNANPTASAIAGQRFLIDGVMLEQSGSANQYIDSSFISWNGDSNLSSSKLGNSYILNNTSSSLPSPAIWISASSKFQSLGGTLYINGASVSDNTYGASTNELYHVALVLSASNNSNLYLNGNNTVVPSNSNKSTFGYLQFWNSAPTSSNILSRYNQFIGKVPTKIIDNNTTKVVSSSSTDKFVITKIG
jgi:hypothetical protein